MCVSCKESFDKVKIRLNNYENSAIRGIFSLRKLLMGQGIHGLLFMINRDKTF